MDDNQLFDIPLHPGSYPSIDDITEYTDEIDRLRKHRDRLDEYEERLVAHAKWAPSNTPESYRELIASVKEGLPEEDSDVYDNPTVFVTSILALIALLISKLNEITSPVQYSLSRENKGQEARVKKFSERIESKSKYDTLRHSSTWHLGVSMSADIFKSSGTYAFVDDSGETSFWLSQEQVEWLSENYPNVIALGDTALSQKGRKPIEDKERVAFTWDRVQGKQRGKNYVVKFVPMEMFRKFHDARGGVYRDHIRHSGSIDISGDYAESQTERIMRELDLL